MVWTEKTSTTILKERSDPDKGFHSATVALAELRELHQTRWGLEHTEQGKQQCCSRSVGTAVESQAMQGYIVRLR